MNKIGILDIPVAEDVTFLYEGNPIDPPIVHGTT